MVIVSAVAQWLFYMFFYKQFVEDKLTNYVDLCSVSNISVFIMAQRQFGYYIHGQNVNGKADVSLAQMYANFEREQRGVCAKRGMDMDSDNQTFMMALPNDMRIEFDKLYMPFAEGGNLDQSLDTYHKLNDFLKVSRSACVLLYNVHMCSKIGHCCRHFLVKVIRGKWNM